MIRGFGKYAETALREPVVISKNGRDRLVLIAIDEYRSLTELIKGTDPEQSEIETHGAASSGT
jgi:prevent-host-death family protein